MADGGLRCENDGMSTHLLALYVAAVFLAMIAPGPDMMFILATGMRGGARAGLLATLGVVSSEVVQITAVAAGLSALFAEAPVAFTVLRLGGAAYLLYLGVQALRSARRGSPLEDSQPGTRVSGRYAYLRGAATNLVNPKSVTFVVALLPQFIDRSLGHVPLQFAVLGEPSSRSRCWWTALWDWPPEGSAAGCLGGGVPARRLIQDRGQS